MDTNERSSILMAMTLSTGLYLVKIKIAIQKDSFPIQMHIALSNFVL